MKRILILVLLVLFNCNKDSETLLTNAPPSDFEVNVLSDSYLSSQIEWSESFDSDDEVVKYSVHLNDKELANNLSVRIYNFENLEPLTEYSGKVIAFDSNENKTVKNFSFTTTGNLPPKEFSINSVDPSNISINIYWEESIDPENENVSYDIYVNEELTASDLQQTYYLIENLNVSTDYNIKVVAKDESSNTTELTFNETTLNGIYEGDIDFTFQNEIDNFGKLGYVEINGSVEISGFLGNSDINNLSGLGSIKKITGRFEIRSLDELTNLSGLNIEFIGGRFSILNNENLQYLDNFESLNEILGSFEIDQNRHLLNINGFKNLVTIGGYLSVENNGVKEVIGFENLKQLDGIHINYNSLLTLIEGFNKIETLDHNFNINNNTSLSSIIGFNLLRKTSGFYIKDTLILDLNVFNSLQSVSEMSISDNGNLVNLEGLSSLSEVSSLYIFRNNNLRSINGLEKIELTDELFTFQIGLNPVLVDFCILQNYVKKYILTPSGVSIYSNEYNPSEEEIANGKCTL